MSPTTSSTSRVAASSAAIQCLDSLATNIRQNQSPKTLAAWRLSDPSIVVALKTFASGQEWTCTDDQNVRKYQAEVQALFGELNAAMVRQEQSDWAADVQTKVQTADKDEISIVFGGKAPLKGRPARSISERLVQLLLLDSDGSSAAAKVYTVSRTEISPSDLPANVVHFAKTGLDDEHEGASQYEEVLRSVLSSASEKSTLTVYFTLGQHKGINPFARNVAAAQNLAKALREIAPVLDERKCNTKIRVVLTGTDATKPRTHPNSNVSIAGGEYLCPSYRTEDRNFVYAMSKLCQFYTIADVVLDLISDERITCSTAMHETSDVLKANVEKLTRAVIAAGEDGSYRDEIGIPRGELDEMSKLWDTIEQDLSPHVTVAKSISIVYTPLHGNAWTNEAMKKSKCSGDEDSEFSPRAYLVQQVVSRLKNAISIDRAAKSHLLP